MLTSAFRAAGGKQSLKFVGGYASNSGTTTATPSFSLTSLTGGIASAPAVGDIVIACISLKNSVNLNITCDTSGYTEVVALRANGTNDSQLGIFYKILTAADTSVAFYVPNSVYSFFAAHVWRNPNSTQFDATTTTQTNSVGGVPNPPSITTVTDKAIVIAVGAAAGSGTALLNSFTTPSGMTNFFQDTISNIAGVAIASYTQNTAGAYDPPAFGGGNSSSSCTYCAATLAIRPK
jgi:hypothetical protein